MPDALDPSKLRDSYLDQVELTELDNFPIAFHSQEVAYRSPQGAHQSLLTWEGEYAGKHSFFLV
jgi:hypothetical protein